MIQEYLNLQLIKTKEDGNLEKLKKTASVIAKEISENKAKILSYTLVAFDPEIPADNKEIIEVKKLIIEEWQTFVANSKDTALTVIRAVMLEALNTVSKEISNAALIWFAGRNIINYFKLGREESILTNFLEELGNKVEQNASENFTFPPDEEIIVPDITPAIVDKGEIEKTLKAAIINKELGEGGENPNHPTDTEASWGKFFATRASKGIIEFLNKALKNQANEITQKQRMFIHQMSLLQMRTQLLWWREAKFSPLLQNTYEGLEDGKLELILAYDYSNFVPSIYPASVDYFLKESHRMLIAEDAKVDRKLKISELLKSIDKNSSSLKEFIPDNTINDSRISFVNFIIGLIHGKYQVKQFKRFVGISESTDISLTEITVWLFHDLNSIKLSN